MSKPEATPSPWLVEHTGEQFATRVGTPGQFMLVSGPLSAVANLSPTQRLFLSDPAELLKQKLTQNMSKRETAKVRQLAVIQLGLAKPALTFEDVSKAADLPIDEVEEFLVHALIDGAITGVLRASTASVAVYTVAPCLLTDNSVAAACSSAGRLLDQTESVVHANLAVLRKNQARNEQQEQPWPDFEPSREPGVSHRNVRGQEDSGPLHRRFDGWKRKRQLDSS